MEPFFGHSMELKESPSRSGPGTDGDGAGGEGELSGDHSREGLVGSSLFGRGGEGDLEGVAHDADDAVAGCPGLHPDGQEG